MSEIIDSNKARDFRRKQYYLDRIIYEMESINKSLILLQELLAKKAYYAAMPQHSDIGVYCKNMESSMETRGSNMQHDIDRIADLVDPLLFDKFHLNSVLLTKDIFIRGMTFAEGYGLLRALEKAVTEQITRTEITIETLRAVRNNND